MRYRVICNSPLQGAGQVAIRVPTDPILVSEDLASF